MYVISSHDDYNKKAVDTKMESKPRERSTHRDEKVHMRNIVTATVLTGSSISRHGTHTHQTKQAQHSMRNALRGRRGYIQEHILKRFPDMTLPKSYPVLAVLVLAMTIPQNVESIKTEDDIIKDIQSMANGIKKECTRSSILNTSCIYYKSSVDNAHTLQDVCTAMDKYIVCQDKYCLNKSMALTQILDDAMVIPFCGPLLNYPEVISYANDVIEMAKLCTFAQGQKCDQQYNNLLTSQNKGQACSAVRLYTTCLEQSCISLSSALKQKIEAYTNNAVCDIRIKVEDINKQCLNSMYTTTCVYTNKAVNNAVTLTDVCVAMQTHAVCQDLNCFEKTWTFKNLLSEAKMTTICRLVTNMTMSPKVETILANVNGMMDLCQFNPGHICVWKNPLLVHFLTSLELSDVCQAQANSANCLGVLCLFPSNNLQQQLLNATNTYSCVHMPDVPPATPAQSTQARTTMTTTSLSQSTQARTTMTTTSLSQSTQARTTMTTTSLSQTLAGIQLLASQMWMKCRNEVFSAGCNRKWLIVNTSTNVQAACSALDTYVICQERNCRLTSMSPANLFGESYLNYCGKVTNMIIDYQTEEIAYGVVYMFQQCTLIPGATCSSKQDILLTSTVQATICQAQTSYANCLQHNCDSQSSDLKQLITKALHDPACGNCNLLQVSVLGILMAAVIHWM